ncbi:viroplasmin family protein [Enterocloster bolteae]|uniref:ribonuclease H1 domain-containing protein n=1 Tax=Enterocloster bolteae TaxID=208479 RepID=UPI003AF0A42C
MAKKKFYAVRKGLKIGVYDNWEECQSATKGFSNAEYKSFSTREEAEQYLVGENVAIKKCDNTNETFNFTPNKVIAYVDGSYDDKIKKYAFGCVILTPSGDTIKESGNGDNPASLALRNVAGEMLGSMFAVKWALTNGYSQIEIRYDYEGIEKWVTGEWKAKNELTKKYADSMNVWKTSISIEFLKVVAHSNNKYNDEADTLAKKALTEGTGIPKIKKGDYWFIAESIKREDVLSVIELIKEEFKSNISERQNDLAHGISITLTLDKNDKITIHHYNTNKLMVQGKPKSLFSSIITYITELVDIEEIPKIFNETYKLNIDKNNIRDEYQYYLPNSYDKFNAKMERVLHQAVYNLHIKDEMFDGTFLTQPALRVLEGHLKKIVIENEIVPNHQYIKYKGFDIFEQNGAKYQLKSNFYGKADAKTITYLGQCYTFYHNNRHILEHWDDSTAPLDTTKTIDCSQAHDLIKRTLAIIDDFYSI